MLATMVKQKMTTNQLCEVLLLVCSKMADETNLSSKLPVAGRTSEVRGRKLYW